MRAARFASAIIGASAILGCAGDNIVAPAPAVAITATSVEQSATPHHEVVEAVVSPVVVVASAFDSTSAGDMLARPVTGSTSTRSDRYGREQTLGFDRDAPTTDCLSEGASTGQWQLRYSGYGCVGLTADDAGTALSMQPATAADASETHAPLLLGPEFGDRMILNTRVETVQQLRRNTEPNAWEVAWIVWQYQDDDHFYYFIPKPNGWELGKRDPSYPGGQRFLASSTTQKFPVGQTYNVQVTHRGNVFAVAVDGTPIVSFTDAERPYRSGRIALYSEDAAIRVHQVSVRTGVF